LRSRRHGVESKREDLLKQIEGVDGRVRKGLRLRWLGHAAASLSTAALTVILGYFYHQDLSATEVLHKWPFLVSTGGVLASAALVSQGRQWIHDAREPFRYTFSVDPFEPISTPQDEGLNWARDWICADLILMLNDRIGRLSLLPQEKVTGDSPEQPAAHIHISGKYGSRNKRGYEAQVAPLAKKQGEHNEDAGLDLEKKVTIELMPRVRIGSDACSAAVAYAVRFDEPVLPDLRFDRVKYDHILERVYFNVATQIYRQIRLDIDRKIARLPTAYLRATAYFNEAEDYARSNTLDAFHNAGELYSKALEHYDRSRIVLRKLPLLQRPPARMWAWGFATWRWIARWLTNLVPRFGRRDVQIARAKTGYAKVTLFRNILANLSGREATPIFEARRYAREAVKELGRLRHGVPQRDHSLFQAHLIAALAEHWAGDIEAAQAELEAARDLRPATAEQDELFPFASGCLEPRLHRKTRLLQRAVELHPRFEIAHFELAFNQEQLWRSSDDLDNIGAKVVKDGYEHVTTLFPANLSAWANLGYIRWLLWDPKQADGAAEVIDAFEGGRRYKEIREEAFVAELDYGLARVFAEIGKLDKAYTHYVSASQANMAQATSDGSSYYWFDRVNGAILHRFRRYERNVAREIALQAKQLNPRPDWLDKVHSFALTDWGNACASYYQRSGDTRFRTEALKAFSAAIEHNPRNVLALRARAAVHLWNDEGDPAKATEDLETIHRYEPRWLPGRLDLVTAKVAAAKARRGDAELLDAARAASTDLLVELPKTLPGKRMNPGRSIRWVKWFSRSRETFLKAVTGPTADALVAWVQASALAVDRRTQRSAERVSRYVQANLLPANRILLELGGSTARRAGKIATKMSWADWRVVQRNVENDPGNHYWLRQLVASQNEARDGILADLLRMAARWPGASWQTLEALAGELEKRNEDELSELAGARAHTRRRDFEDLDRSYLLELVEQHLVDGDFDDAILKARVELIAPRSRGDTGDDQAELLEDARGAAFPVAYLLAADGYTTNALSLLDRITVDADQREATIAKLASEHLSRADFHAALRIHLPR
jgi:hypothetical protein